MMNKTNSKRVTARTLVKIFVVTFALVLGALAATAWIAQNVK
jgi:hypothetical protein